MLSKDYVPVIKVERYGLDEYFAKMPQIFQAIAVGMPYQTFPFFIWVLRSKMKWNVFR